jgi:hypothetical protein
MKPHAERCRLTSIACPEEVCVWQLLLHSTDLRQNIGLSKVPHWTTLQKNADRLLSGSRVQKLLESTLKLSRPRQRVASSRTTRSTSCLQAMRKRA